MPKVSIVIPTHNRADLLRSAIASVMEQSYKDWELIVIDDNSTDHTYKIVNCVNDRRVRYFRNTGKSGPSVARNIGMSKATGEYIAFLDDDDIWLPKKLEKQVAVLEKSTKKVCGIYSNRSLIDKNTGKIISKKPDVEKFSGSLLKQLIIKNPIHTSTFVFRKECISKIGYFDESMRYSEDRDFWIRLSMNWNIKYIDEPLIKAFYHGNSHLSTNLEGQIKGREKIIKKYDHLIRQNRKNWSKLYICQGAEYCQMKLMKKGRKNLLKGILIYPFLPISYLHLIFSCFGKNNYQRIRLIYKNRITKDTN